MDQIESLNEVCALNQIRGGGQSSLARLQIAKMWAHGRGGEIQLAIPTVDIVLGIPCRQ